MKTKSCKNCLLSKHYNLYYKQKNSKDGLRNLCKECWDIKTRLWKTNNIERHRDIQRKCNKERNLNMSKKDKQKRIKYVAFYNKTRDNGLYIKYMSMNIRCRYPSQENYKYYGGRGIKCEWESYQSFKKDMYESYKIHLNTYGKKETTLDRLDFNGNYCKENCRWSNWKQQALNKHIYGSFSKAK
jgi:hypothetical protein